MDESKRVQSIEEIQIALEGINLNIVKLANRRRGTVTMPDGTRYEGEWKDGKRHGRGTTKPRMQGFSGRSVTNVGRFGKLGEKEEINVGRFGKLGEKEEINVGRFGKLGDDLFADEILSVFNNIDESKSSLLKVENEFINDGKGGQEIRRIREGLDEVVAGFASVVDEHIQVNDKNCEDCACDKMDNSSGFIMELQKLGSDFSTELKNGIEKEGDTFWSSMGIDEMDEGKKNQLGSLINALSDLDSSHL